MAITSVTYEPQDYRTVYNPIEYVATSNQTAQSRFKYLFDVYDGATQIASLKVPADPNGYGRADVHGICESYIKTDLGIINTGATADAFTDNENSYKEFTIKIGEEWFVGSTLNSNPDQEIRTVITYNGCLPNYRVNSVNFADYQATNYYQRFVNNSNTRRFLTNSPKGTGANGNNQSVELTDEGWLYFLYDDASHALTAFDLTLYNAAGGVTAIYQINVPAITLTDIKMLKIPFAPNSINNILPAQINTTPAQPIITNETSYKIVLKNGGAASEEIYFNIDNECRYEVRRLEFLNALGGFDCFNFTKVSKKSEDIERKFYKQNADNLNGSGVIDYNLADREKVQYYTKSMPKMKLTSDWIDAQTFNWLLELIDSPEIYLHENGERIAVKNIEGNWEEKRANVDRSFNLEVNLEFSIDNYRQRF
mgnify:CR=1 FL=1|tara:strand:- start:1618 stop:2889 length:1272 start_codon:yes stop_codon:yes gene_type:complete